MILSRCRGLAVELLACVLVCAVAPVASFAATGCDLNNPDRDVPRIFPGSTRYVAKYRSPTPMELAAIVAQLDERFRAIYDPLSVPYTIYEIYRGDEKVGYIHGVNQKGQFGTLQVFIAQDITDQSQVDQENNRLPTSQTAAGWRGGGMWRGRGRGAGRLARCLIMC